MLEARNLSKRYQALLAVDNVSFTINPGEILGYLGPNGSGKSTTINMVVGLLDATSGSLSLFGQRLTADPEEYKRRIGYVPEEPHLYTYLTAPEYLRLVGQLRGLRGPDLDRKIEQLLKAFGLWESRYASMSAFSKGMRQRVLLSAALLHNPQLLVLDEPFAGLDVSAGLLFRTLLRLFVRDGRLVLFSSHRLDVVEQLCSRAVILHGGRVVAVENIENVGHVRGPEASHSLEDVFARVTRQEDYTSVAENILEVVRS
ncbi:MAG: ABC transporter [Acidobacteria bacterium RIFCSPLOWO2_12_FULL_65_11]|nr:MAG: ABC transporter [Acidobacteria bacterium RIFCSPLOWO2_02_FULL_64_15]OFW29227.1 MAG: ABC transporter [Acidobacteria bacterium RIFCSPLOWO2_12_FULL_65_11]